MSYGINFNNQKGFRVLDGGRLIPQFLGKVSLNGPNGYIDVPDVHPGYFMRSYRDYTPSVFNNRNTIQFWSIPGVNQDAWYLQGSAFLYSQSLNPNTLPHPEVYVFAVDYVTPSNAKWGCRIYGPGGSPLVYDSGTPALNIHTLIPNVSISTSVPTIKEQGPTGDIRTFGLSNGVPIKPAIVMTYVNGSRQWGQRFNGYGDWQASACMRIINGQLQTRFMMTDYSFTEEENQRSNYDQYYVDGQRNNFSVPLSTMMIDASLYD